MNNGLMILAGAVLAAASLVAVGCSKTDIATEHKSLGGLGFVTVTDQWVKAAPTGMTGLLGTLKNAGEHEVNVVSASSPVAGKVELHEVVGQAGGGSVMQPKEGGFPIPAGGTHVLAPGADHIMLMDLASHSRSARTSRSPSVSRTAPPCPSLPRSVTSPVPTRPTSPPADGPSGDHDPRGPPESTAGVCWPEVPRRPD